MNLLAWFKKPQDKKSDKYEFYKIYYHEKYNGTYMLFGFSKERKRMLLVNQSVSPMDVHEWVKDYDCTMPDMRAVADNAFATFGC